VNDGEWLLIAEFARRCRLPVSTLRYYDRVGLLPPAAVDPVTGYRRYRADQLPVAVTIARLRSIGTTPDVIARVLRGGREAAAALDDERRRLTEEIADRTRALAHLDELADPTSCEPGIPRCVDLTATRVPALPFSATFPDLAATITRGIATLRARLRDHRLLPPRPEWGAVLPLDLDDHVTGHVFARLRNPPAGFTTVALPHGPAVVITHHGSHGRLAHSYDQALTAIRRRGLRPTGPVIEDYSQQGRLPQVRICVPTARLLQDRSFVPGPPG
jgi:DNA-binding transcriptional MerR regulator